MKANPGSDRPHPRLRSTVSGLLVLGATLDEDDGVILAADVVA
jgi:hypothetical protein